MLPGTIWSALLVALPLLSLWLQDSFPAAVWAAPLAGLILIVAKTIEAMKPAPASLPEGLEAEAAPEPKKSTARRWLLG